LPWVPKPCLPKKGKKEIGNQAREPNPINWFGLIGKQPTKKKEWEAFLGKNLEVKLLIGIPCLGILVKACSKRRFLLLK